MLIPCLADLFVVLVEVMVAFAQLVRIHKMVIVKCLMNDNSRLEVNALARNLVEDSKRFLPAANICRW